MSLVICNKRIDKCKNCDHYEPHEPVEEYHFHIKCTKWGPCHRNDGEYIQVRCTKTDEEKGIN